IVWAALVVDTAGLAQQATAPPRFPTAAAPTATATPPPPLLAAPRPAQVLQDIVAASDQRLTGFHPKTGRYISAWLPDSFDSANPKSFEANADILDEVSTFGYTTTSRGDILADEAARDKTLVDLAH